MPRLPLSRRQFLASRALALVPGPNVLAYCLGFFVVARYLSWRGANHGLRARAVVDRASADQDIERRLRNTGDASQY